MLEYLLAMVIIVVLVFVAFKNEGGNVLSQTRNKTVEYFDSGAMGIMGGYWDSATKKFVRIEPARIDGGWCQGGCASGYMIRECACPRPAFGGDQCVGNAVMLNADCP